MAIRFSARSYQLVGELVSNAMRNIAVFLLSARHRRILEEVVQIMSYRVDRVTSVLQQHKHSVTAVDVDEGLHESLTLMRSR